MVLFFSFFSLKKLYSVMLYTRNVTSPPEIIQPGWISSLLAFQFTFIRFHIIELLCLMNTWWVLSPSRDDHPMPLKVHYYFSLFQWLEHGFVCPQTHTVQFTQPCMNMHRKHTQPASLMLKFGRSSFLSGQNLSGPQWFVPTPPPVVPLQKMFSIQIPLSFGRLRSEWYWLRAYNVSLPSVLELSSSLGVCTYYW